MIRLVQNSFFGGQLDFEMMGRQDYQRYAKGATRLCNFNIMKRGGLDKRHGWDRVYDLTQETGVTANTKFRMIPFAYKKTQGFVLCMSGPKCIVVSTNHETIFKKYDVTGLDGVYSSNEIQELDYQQCGDTLFIAHQNHPPAKIEHYIGTDGEHGFTYSTMDMSDRMNGIPSITNAHINRIAVVDDQGTYQNAGLFTEHYKVTAVYNGIETYPCSDYSKVHSNPRGGASWDGTNYPMPWTESQILKLTIQPNQKFDAKTGRLIYPDEIRVYKKAFNYFGLIGVQKLKDANPIEAGSMTLPSNILKNSDDTATYGMYDEAGDAVSYGRNRCSWVFDGTQRVMTFTAAPKNTGRVKICLGNVRYQIAQDGNSVTFLYTGWTATKIKIGLSTKSSTQPTTQYIAETELPASGGDKSYTVTKETGESASDFSARWRADFVDWASRINDTQVVYCNFTAGGTSYKYMFFDIIGGSVPIANMKFYTDATTGSFTFEDNYITPDASITPPEEPDDDDKSFVGEGNYPASVSISQQRLIWASSKNDPARVWMSQVGDFYTYCSHEVQVPDDAIDFTLPVTRFAKINHICEMRKLLMFNSACEWLVDSASSVQGLTFETIQAYPQSYSGSSERLKPIICNNSLVFCERTGQAVRRFAYDISNDGFAGRDVSVLSASIFENNSIVDWTYQQFPYSTLWCVMANGNMTSFEFMEEQDIMAWMTHELGGGGKAVCVATSYGVAPALDEVADTEAYDYATHEEVFAVIRRGSQLWVERMRVKQRPPVANGLPSTNSLYHALCLDGIRILNSTNGNQPTEEEGAIWIPSDTTDGKPITRDEALAKLDSEVEVYEGFPFDAEYISVYPNINNGTLGNGQFDIKHIQGCGLRLMNSTGGEVLSIGSKIAEPIQYYYNDPENDHRAVFEDGNVTLFNHDTGIMALNGVNNRDGRVKIVSRDPYPFSVLSYEIDFEPETGGFGGQR